MTYYFVEALASGLRPLSGPTSGCSKDDLSRKHQIGTLCVLSVHN